MKNIDADALVVVQDFMVKDLENMTTEDGHLTKELYDIYENLARSEVGLIITGYANIIKEQMNMAAA